MEIDRTNKRILALLEDDARMSMTAISRAINLSRPAVQDRIKSMEHAGIIQGYRTIIGDSAGLVHAAMFVQISEPPCDRALQWLSSLEGVTSVLSLAGEIDAMVSVTVPSTARLTALIDQVTASPLIRSAKSNVVLRRYEPQNKLS